jgi:hypothetical protein
MTTKTTTKKTTTKKTARKATPKKATPKKAPAKKPARANTTATVAKGKPKASTKAKPAKNATRAKNAATSDKPKRVSGLDLAAKVLAEARRPLPAKDITELVLAAGWKTNGKTPHATLYAAMIREIAKKGKDARFVKTDRGLFTAAPKSGKGA